MANLDNIAIGVTSKDFLSICNDNPGASRLITDFVAWYWNRTVQETPLKSHY